MHFLNASQAKLYISLYKIYLYKVIVGLKCGKISNYAEDLWTYH